MNPNPATEYRNLPLAVLTESTTNPRHIFEDAALKALACQANHRARLRDRSRSEALPRRADGRGYDRPRPHRQPHRCRSDGGGSS
jgi:hypothetical protein